MGKECKCGCTHKCNTSEEQAVEKSVIAQICAPLISALFLISGLVFSHFKLAWFGNPIVELGWYVLGVVPVALPVMREAWNEMKQKEIFNEFTLMIIASLGAFYIGEYPEALAVMLLYTIGETLQGRAVDRATRNIRNLLDVRSETVNVYRNNSYVTISPRDVNVGELIEVRSGERVSLDGVLKSKQALFDASALTGESIPQHLTEGDEVLAGMIASGQTVRIEVTKPYSNSALARILNLVQEASERKATTELFIRKFARIYTPIVVLLAFLITIVPAIVAPLLPNYHYIFAHWLYRSLVFLVASCPCALIIGIPLGYFAGIGAASRVGVLFKGSNYIDAISRVNTIVFDKTGTLTTGVFKVTSVQASGIGEDELLRYVVSAEKKSTHPIAQAVVEYANERGVIASDVDNIHELPGYGLEAEIGEHIVVVGNIRMLKERNVSVPQDVDDRVSTIVACAIDGVYAGCLLLADTLKEDSKETINRLKDLKIDNIEMLSGDRQEIVDTFAQQLGIDKATGNLLPEGKVAHLNSLIDNPDRRVAFVGDGMNDAPVLALSDVGIAMGAMGSDAAIESADIVIQTDRPLRVATAIQIGRYTKHIVMQNIAGAISVKVLVLLAAALGYATLWAAVFADVGVTMLVVLNSIRILTKGFK